MSKKKLADHWDDQALTWDQTITSPKSPHYHYYLTTALYIQSFLDLDCKMVLEAGCGTGSSTLEIIDHKSASPEIVAYDFSKGMIRKAKARLKEQNPNRVHLIVADAHNPPFRPESFDMIFSRGALINYTEDPIRFLVEHALLLKPGCDLLFDFVTGRPGGPMRSYSVEEIERFVRAAGLSKRAVYPMGMFLNLRKNPELMDFVNRHREIFCRIEMELADRFRIEKSVMALIDSQKEVRANE